MFHCDAVELRAQSSRLLSPLLTLVVAFGVVLDSDAAFAGANPAVIDNGTIEIGVDTTACLNVFVPPPAAPEGGPNPDVYGVRDIATGYEGVSGGDPYEGWGLADLNAGKFGISGGAISAASFFGGTFNLVLSGFALLGEGTEEESTGRRVIAQHDISLDLAAPEGTTNLMRVTHDFRPSGVPRLYEVEVTIQNLSPNDIRPRYRRLVDWDVQPEKFNEYVTIHHGPSTAVVASAGDGYQQSADPLVPLFPGSCTPDVDFEDCGPAENGGALDFEFPEVPPGGRLVFSLFYGAAPNEAHMLAALDAVGASAYSLGESATDGTPMTFALGFKAPWAIIDNGTVELGVDMFAALNVYGGTVPSGVILASPSRGDGVQITGLRNVATNFDGLQFGIPREGWGVADLDSATGSGTTSLVVSPAPPVGPEPEGVGSPPVAGFNMSPVDLEVLGTGTLPESVGRRAIVTTLIDDPPILRVIHDFRPSSSPNLYEIIVDLENLSGAPVNPRYRRIGDWDVLPGADDDHVTIDYSKASPLIGDTEGGGFVPPNPLLTMNDTFSPCVNDVPLDDCGPGPIGMAIDFELDTIPVGGREQFLLFYGSAADSTAAVSALSAVGAQAYSIARDGDVVAPEIVIPVFAFGFRDVLFVDDFETSDTSRWSVAVP